MFGIELGKCFRRNCFVLVICVVVVLNIFTITASANETITSEETVSITQEEYDEFQKYLEEVAKNDEQIQVSADEYNEYLDYINNSSSETNEEIEKESSSNDFFRIIGLIFLVFLAIIICMLFCFYFLKVKVYLVGDGL